jgi:glyoxylase-like metal-dependent hydrolase (beta-lactamase superfamily II)
MSLKFSVGDLTIHRIIEQETSFVPALEMLPGLTAEVLAENRAWMREAKALDEQDVLLLCFQSYVVKTPHHTILIDSCIGNDKPRPNRAKWNMKTDDTYLRALGAAGFSVDDIDVVMCTHLHVDHVGWNTRLENGRWVPTFPNARYVFSKTDYDHFLAIDRDPEKGPAIIGAFRDSVLPVVEAGQAHMIEGPQAIEEHISTEPAPGHTPGHVVIKLDSQGSQGFFAGDVIHHAIQVYQPDWTSFACLDRAMAIRSRRKLLENCAGSGALLLPQHFGAPHLCHVDHKGDGFVPRFI